MVRFITLLKTSRLIYHTVYNTNETAVAVETSPGVFDYPYTNGTDPTSDGNVAAAKVNAFYVLNAIHDISYLYGFTEQAFNFQSNNSDKGGKGDDAVLVSVQATGFNNARFSTPPEYYPHLICSTDTDPDI
jgi:extracellular elastinolytic metalloproteinase